MRKIMMALAAMSVVAPLAAPTPADARVRHYRHHYYHTCHRKNGTTGAAVTHGSTGPIVGGVGGALLGRHIQRHNTRYRC